MHGFQEQAAKKEGHDVVGAAAIVKKSKKVFSYHCILCLVKSFLSRKTLDKNFESFHFIV